MIGCDSDEEQQLTRGIPLSTNQVSRCLSENLSEETTDHCRQVPKSDIEPPYAPSPIYELPADVLRSIFEMYCQVELPVDFPLRFSHPQLIASQVCSAWRQIMLGNPIFWNKIRVTIYRLTRYEQMVKVIHIWLSRAKDLPCLIFLHWLIYGDPPFQLDIDENMVRNLIAPHKFKSLGVMFADYHLHDLLHLPDEKLSCIEVLSLHHVHDEDNPLILRCGHPVTSGEDQYFQIFSRIPWHQLRHIHLDICLPALRCLTILETSSSVLETCSLAVSADLSIATSPLSQMTPIHCQQLREFTVDIRPKITGNSFLFLLRFPKLKSLTLEYLNIDQVSIDALLRMWSVRLEKLIILVWDVDAGALLASMPSLRCLELSEGSIFTVDAIRELGAGSIGPFLEELTVNNSKIADEIGELIQMVKTRSSTEKENSAPKSTPTPFKYVHLYCDDPDGSFQQEYGATIDEINQLGVKLTVEFLD
ncbi:hypothetical protein JOM56_001880, partial [Amanita muscaria]